MTRTGPNVAIWAVGEFSFLFFLYMLTNIYSIYNCNYELLVHNLFPSLLDFKGVFWVKVRLVINGIKLDLGFGRIKEKWLA